MPIPVLRKRLGAVSGGMIELEKMRAVEAYGRAGSLVRVVDGHFGGVEADLEPDPPRDPVIVVAGSNRCVPDIPIQPRFPDLG